LTPGAPLLAIAADIVEYEKVAAWKAKSEQATARTRHRNYRMTGASRIAPLPVPASSHGRHPADALLGTISLDSFLGRAGVDRTWFALRADACTLLRCLPSRSARTGLWHFGHCTKSFLVETRFGTLLGNHGSQRAYCGLPPSTRQYIPVNRPTVVFLNCPFWATKGTAMPRKHKQEEPQTEKRRRTERQTAPETPFDQTSSPVSPLETCGPCD
jgi:hypothetical protein